jgi:Uma2 family endonuclease
MDVPIIDTGSMTVEQFYAFTDGQPDEEKWELIDGEPVLNASPSPLHQWIVRNLIFAIVKREPRHGAPWGVLPGIGVRVSNVNRPEPDVMILPRTGQSIDPHRRDRSDVMVAVEVLSPSTEDRDLNWKRSAYTKLASLTHYIVVAQDAVDVVVFARVAGFVEQRLQSLDDSIELTSLGISLPLEEIYRDTGLTSASL